MIEHNKGTEDRDEVLFAFHQACERPTAEQIIDWTDRYPQFAEDIRAHAAISRDWEAREGLAVAEANEAMLARGYSNALNALYNADIKASTASVSESQSFHDILSACGKEVFHLARELDIARGVLADLFNGWMVGPIRKRLRDAVVSSLNMTHDAFDSALQFALQNPRLGHAKADNVPTVTPRSCDEIIRDSNMSPERKRYWLGED
jgi:hypothetical protein